MVESSPAQRLHGEGVGSGQRPGAANAVGTWLWGQCVGVDGRWSSRLRLTRWHGDGVGPEQRARSSERCRDIAIGSMREFDPGSEQTLAACLTHASRTRKSASADEYSGARVSNAWVIYPSVRNNPPKGGLIPDNTDTLRSVFQRRPLFTSFRRRMSPRTIS